MAFIGIKQIIAILSGITLYVVLDDLFLNQLFIIVRIAFYLFITISCIYLYKKNKKK